MPVIINFKVCDNASVCDAIKVCPTGAFKWNEEKKTLEIDEKLCINCGTCATAEESCKVGAIRFAKTQKELEEIKKEIDSDPRTIADLMVDRYGSQPINMPFYCKENELEDVLSTSKTCFIEILDEELEECLIKSIPIKEIINDTIKDCVYRKIEVETDLLIQKYNINQLPSLLVFKNKKLLGKVEGYYPQERKEELISKIMKIIEL